MALIFIATLFGPISSTTPLLALMLGLAVGIDYSLFIISPASEPAEGRASLRRSRRPDAVATAGSAVLFAGITVIIALVGLSVAGIPFLTTMGIAASVAVAIAVLISLTLTPALLGFAGARITPGTADAAKRAAACGDGCRRRRGRGRAGTLRRRRATPPPRRTLAHAAKAEVPPGFFRGWVRAVTRFPIVTIVAVVAVLGIAAIPAPQLRLALPDAGSHAAGDPARVTYDLISEHFGPGYNGPLIVTGSIIVEHRSGRPDDEDRRRDRRDARRLGRPARHPEPDRRHRHHPGHPDHRARLRQDRRSSSPRSARSTSTSSTSTASTSRSPATRPRRSTSPTASAARCCPSASWSSGCRSCC